MASALALLGELEKDDKPKRTSTVKSSTSTKSAKAKGKTAQSSSPVRSSSRTSTRSKTPTIPIPTDFENAYAPYERSPSRGPDSRRISFAEAPRPSAGRLRIATLTDSLASGFPYDQRLFGKYGVVEPEWLQFSNMLVEAADVPGSNWTWAFHRKDVIKRIKKELQYDGELKRVLKRWNKHFKAKRCQVWLELPNSKDEKEYESEALVDTKEERQRLKLEAKRFRVVVSPSTDHAPSVYSRSSSLTRSVSGEAAELHSNTLANSESLTETGDR